MRSWDFFFPSVMPDVLGCPEPTVELHLFDAARLFCEKSRCWRETLDPIVTEAGITDYDLSFPTGAEAYELVDGTLNGRTIGLEVTDAVGLEDQQNATRGPDRVLTTDLRTLHLYPAPGAGSVLSLKAIMQPAEGAQGLPDAVADKYRRAIANGALSTLLVLNKAAWFNPQLAGLKDDAFRKAIADAKSQAWRAHTNTRPRVRAMHY